MCKNAHWAEHVFCKNTLVLLPDEVYAGISRFEWESIVKELEIMDRVNLDDIEPENRECDICREPFSRERPVSLPCRHIFGEKCLKSWIAVDRGWDTSDSEADSGNEQIEVVSGSDFYQLLPDSAFVEGWPVVESFVCPKCRQPYTVPTSRKTATLIQARLRLWDHVYKKLNIQRSREEEECRQDLWRFVGKCHVGVTKQTLLFEERAQISAMRFALQGARQSLDPLQREFREAFFNLACYGVFNTPKIYNPNDYEHRSIPLWCWQFDRFERGLDFSYALLQGAGFRRRFLEEWLQQRLGPWRRRLFAELRDSLAKRESIYEREYASYGSVVGASILMNSVHSTSIPQHSDSNEVPDISRNPLIRPFDGGE